MISVFTHKRRSRLLEEVSLAGSSGFKRESLLFCVKKWKRLRELNVSFIDARDKSGIFFANNDASQADTKCAEEDAVVQNDLFAALGGGLERLSARRNPWIDDNCIGALHAPYLRNIDVGDIEALTKHAFEDLVARCGALVSYISDAEMSTNITTDALEMQFRNFSREPAPQAPFEPPPLDEDDDDDDEHADADRNRGRSAEKRPEYMQQNLLAVPQADFRRRSRSKSPLRKMTNILRRLSGADRDNDDDYDY